MSYISEIFERLKIQHLREFLLHGCDESEISTKDYKERIDEARATAIDFIRQKFEEGEFEEIAGKVYDYASVCEEVYMEIGLQCGFTLAVQMLNPPQTDLE